MTTESFIRSLENGFRALGGVPKVVVFDNAKSAVIQADWYDPELNPKLVEFCLDTHWVLRGGQDVMTLLKELETRSSLQNTMSLKMSDTGEPCHVLKVKA